HVLLLSIALSVFVFVTRLKPSPVETIMFLLLVNAIPFITERFKKDLASHKQGMRAEFDEVKKNYEELSQKDKKALESNLESDKKLQQVLSLYEISKDMSSCLMLEDIFGIFSATLKKLFRFRLARLVILDGPGGINAVYQVEIGRSVNKKAPDDFDRAIVSVEASGRKPIQLVREEEPESLRKLSVVRDFDTLISIPLFVEEKIAGVLYIENLPKIYFENFMILSGQFAIQFHKVILYEKVQEMSITDSLTRVSTRRYFLERLEEELRRSMRHKTNLSFLMLDLDHFKEKNDKFGHLVGDIVLKEVSVILKASLREIDIVGRYGGEEFAIALTGIGRKGALQVAERIRQNIEEAVFKAYDETVSTTVSIGISVFPDDEADMNSLIESADKALYKAKAAGRNKVR
ncbi:MAG: GGDEF domain-containing protein, partial [Candidatus Omnitrophica bacterium]|nr:GGDEF domain-containing protein [Candidatus Omnitrophota bacterium]